MAGLEIEIDNTDPAFFAALNDPVGFLPILGEAMTRIVGGFQEQASVYAPESEANQPGRFSLATHRPMGYYERGRGWWYPLVRRRPGIAQPTMRPHLKAPKTLRVRALRAEGVAGVVGYRLRPTSEQMGQQWATAVEQNADSVTGALTNGASYSGYVQGLEQTKLHKARDWQNVINVWESDPLQALVDGETNRAIDKYYHLQG